MLSALAGFAVLVTACGSDGATTGVERAEAATTSTAIPTTEAETTTTIPPTTTTAPEPERVELAADPAELAVRVTAAERTVRDPATSPAEVATAAFELQQLYRQLGRNPDWDQPVLERTPSELHLSVSANAQARREFRGLHNELSDTLPAWRIVDPEPADVLRSYYEEGEATFGVPWEVLAAVNLVETGFGRIEGTSVAGAQGPMQFMPATWDAYGNGGDINDTHDAIMGAARYLAANGGGSGDLDNALFRYNNSNRYVRAVKHYSSVMTEDPAAFIGFYHWQIVFLSERGDVWLPPGYERTESIPVDEYLAANPDHHLSSDTR